MAHIFLVLVLFLGLAHDLRSVPYSGTHDIVDYIDGSSIGLVIADGEVDYTDVVAASNGTTMAAVWVAHYGWLPDGTELTEVYYGSTADGIRWAWAPLPNSFLGTEPTIAAWENGYDVTFLARGTRWHMHNWPAGQWSLTLDRAPYRQYLPVMGGLP